MAGSKYRACRDWLLRFACLLLVVAPAAAFSAEPQHGPESELSGCVFANAHGQLQIYVLPSRRVYALAGDLSYLQRFDHELVKISAEPQSMTGNGGRQLKVTAVNVIAESCTSVLNARVPMTVTGKAGATSYEFPSSTTASAAENTPGYQTESARRQREGSSGTESATRPPLAPMRPEQAGQSPLEAEQNAVAASRAELNPGTTLGVNAKSANEQAPK